MGILNSEGSVVTGEAWLQKYIRKSNCSVKVIVDVGANTGGYAAELARHFPQAHLYCHEPNPQTYRMLQQTAKKYPCMHTYQQALGDKKGQAQLYDYADTAPAKPSQPTATMASLHQDVIQELHQQPSKS